MQFLKTMFWVIVAVVMVLFASANWEQVTINLWGNLQADVKLPVLVLTAFLLGFIPTFVIYRARLWALQRRLDVQVQAHAVSHPTPVPTGNAPSRPAVDTPAE